MTPRFIRTATLVAVATAAVAGLAAGSGAAVAAPAASAPAAPAAAPATSVPGGYITYAEVLARAADWYHRAPAYNINGDIDYPDLGHTKLYRRDCSGFVDMALHLYTNPTTWQYDDSNRADDFHLVSHLNLHAGSYFTPNNVHTGDFFNDVSDGHVWLFANWASDGKHFTYYSFGGGSSHTDPPELHTGATFSDSSLGYEPRNNYIQWRYTRILAH